MRFNRHSNRGFQKLTWRTSCNHVRTRDDVVRTSPLLFKFLHETMDYLIYIILYGLERIPHHLLQHHSVALDQHQLMHHPWLPEFYSLTIRITLSTICHPMSRFTTFEATWRDTSRSCLVRLHIQLPFILCRWWNNIICRWCGNWVTITSILPPTISNGLLDKILKLLSHTSNVSWNQLIIRLCKINTCYCSHVFQ